MEDMHLADAGADRLFLTKTMFWVEAASPAML